MARRRRKKQITYDSKETKTVLGLLCFVAAVVLFIATFIQLDQENALLFLREWLGITTIVYGFFAVSMGLRFFNSKFPTTNTLSLVSQGILLFLIPAFLASLPTRESVARRVAAEGFAGGKLGVWLAYDLFSDTLVFGQFTSIILGILALIFAPLALSVSINKLVELIIKVIVKIKDMIMAVVNYARTTSDFGQSDNSQNKGADLPATPKATRFGDFQRQPANAGPASAAGSSSDDNKLDKAKAANQELQQNIEEIAEKANVDIKEAEVGEDGLSQTELGFPNWKLPPISLLNPYKKVKPEDQDTKRNAEIIEQTLASFNIDAEVAEAYIGPSVVRYALSIPLGTKVSKIAGLSPTLALGLGVDSNAVRVDTIPGTTFLGIEVPRQNRDFVSIRELIEAQKANAKHNLPMVVGKDIDGKAIIADLQKMPHLLIAGATGSGKSILTNSFITTMLMNLSPDELRLILVDPKQVELMDYNGIPHLLTPVITNMDKVVNALKWAVEEMERRYTVLAHNQVRNIEEFNKKLNFAGMPYIVVVIDEMADMMMTANRVDAENAIVRLTQKARAVGIHLILATQRPSVNVITGLIKANVPARIGMSVASNTDSRVILDTSGAESLMGKGDLLYNEPGLSKVQRLQASFVSQEEVIRVVEYIKSQVPEVEYVTSILEDVSPGSGNPAGGLAAFSEDDQFVEAVNIVVQAQKGSASYLQRKLGVGFNRAARLLEEMEEIGIVGPQIGSKPRDVLTADPTAILAKMKENK